MAREVLVFEGQCLGFQNTCGSCQYLSSILQFDGSAHARGLQIGPHAPFGHPNCKAIVLSQLKCQFVRLRHQVDRFTEPADQADVGGFCGLNHFVQVA